ncbi:hypothetical protein ACRRTK_018974 [Alexandromys fortis]
MINFTKSFFWTVLGIDPSLTHVNSFTDMYQNLLIELKFFFICLVTIFQLL